MPLAIRRLAAIAGASLVAAMVATPALAQFVPTKPLEMVAHGGPGSGNDGFARTLANEVASFNITVNNLMPGYTKTERLVQLGDSNAKAKGISREAAFAAWEQQIPMGRLGEPREFAALAAFLASEQASYITAQSIAVDGGWIRALL